MRCSNLRNRLLPLGLATSLFISLFMNATLFSIPSLYPPGGPVVPCDHLCHMVQYFTACPDGLNFEYQVPDCETCGANSLCIAHPTQGVCVELSETQRVRVWNYRPACPCDFTYAEGLPPVDEEELEWVELGKRHVCAI